MFSSPVENQPEQTTRSVMRSKLVAFGGVGLAIVGVLAAVHVTRAHPAPAVGNVAPAKTAHEPTVTRAKGSAELHVYRQTPSGSEEVLSGDAFSPGDNIRFAVDLPEESRVKIIGVQPDGKYYTAWPQPGSPPVGVLNAGDDQILTGAVSLDNSHGRETLYLIACPPEVGTPTCMSSGSGAAPKCTPGCALSPFVLNKKK